MADGPQQRSQPQDQSQQQGAGSAGTTATTTANTGIQPQQQQDQTQPMTYGSAYPSDVSDSNTALATEPRDGEQCLHDVLVVEDDPEINELIGAYVELAGYHCRRVGRGNDAIAAAQQQCPSLVVLDVMLPDLDGFEICKRLRADPRTAGVPIVMLTALDQEDMRRRACQCGATEYLTKPFDPDRLLDTIQRRMNGKGE